MSILTPLPPSLPLPQRVFFRIPVIGWIARDFAFGGRKTAYFLAAIIATALILSVLKWGLPALVFAALGFVPLMFAFLIIVATPGFNKP